MPRGELQAADASLCPGLTPAPGVLRQQGFRCTPAAVRVPVRHRHPHHTPHPRPGPAAPLPLSADLGLLGGGTCTSASPAPRPGPAWGGRTFGSCGPAFPLSGQPKKVEDLEPDSVQTPALSLPSCVARASHPTCPVPVSLCANLHGLIPAPLLGPATLESPAVSALQPLCLTPRPSPSTCPPGTPGAAPVSEGHWPDSWPFTRHPFTRFAHFSWGPCPFLVDGKGFPVRPRYGSLVALPGKYPGPICLGQVILRQHVHHRPVWSP